MGRDHMASLFHTDHRTEIVQVKSLENQVIMQKRALAAGINLQCT